jgi:hypothetical protein
MKRDHTRSKAGVLHVRDGGQGLRAASWRGQREGVPPPSLVGPALLATKLISSSAVCSAPAAGVSARTLSQGSSPSQPPRPGPGVTSAPPRCLFDRPGQAVTTTVGAGCGAGPPRGGRRPCPVACPLQGSWARASASGVSTAGSCGGGSWTIARSRPSSPSTAAVSTADPGSPPGFSRT